MLDDKFDVIVVGVGVVGMVVVYVMVKVGLDVLVIECGNSVGSKNMIGGWFYVYSIESIMLGFVMFVFIECVVICEKIFFLIEESVVIFDFYCVFFILFFMLYIVLCNKLDLWLMVQVEQVGVQFISGVWVDVLVCEGNCVIGVQVGDDILDVNIVIFVDGVNFMLGCLLDMVFVFFVYYYVVGVKELIGFFLVFIEECFNLVFYEGVVWLFVGVFFNGFMGGGFFYINCDLVFLGLVCGLGDIVYVIKSVL